MGLSHSKSHAVIAVAITKVSSCQYVVITIKLVPLAVAQSRRPHGSFKFRQGVDW